MVNDHDRPWSNHGRPWSDHDPVARDSLVLVIFVIINGRGIMQKPRAQIINFENRSINKSIVFVSLLIHYFAACICSKLWYVMGKV